MNKLKSLSKYNKFWVACVTVVLAGVVQVYGDNQWVQLLVAVAGAVGVYAVPNKVK